MTPRGADQVEASEASVSLLPREDRLPLAVLAAILAVWCLSGCAMQKPVSIVVEKGLIQVEGVGLVSGERVRYRSGVLEEGEAAVTFDGKASGFPATGPAPAPAPTPTPPQ